MKPVLFLAALASVVFAASPTAHADTVTKQFQVTAEILPFCAINADPLDFGDYTTVNISGGQPLDAQSFVRVLCPDGTPFTIGLDGGLNDPFGTTCESGGGTPGRTMKDIGTGLGNLGYQLYSDPAYSQVWGCTPDSDVAGVGNGSTFDDFLVYGRVPAGSVTLADIYTDTITVTVTF